MPKRSFWQYCAAGAALAVLGVLYLAAWVVTFEAFDHPRPLQMHKSKRR